jgi:hypothetical protein
MRRMSAAASRRSRASAQPCATLAADERRGAEREQQPEREVGLEGAGRFGAGDARQDREQEPRHERELEALDHEARVERTGIGDAGDERERPQRGPQECERDPDREQHPVGVAPTCGGRRSAQNLRDTANATECAV